MSRSVGQSEARLLVFKFPSKLDTHLSTPCSRDNLAHPENRNRTGVEARCAPLTEQNIAKICDMSGFPHL
ncbi:hypothetical protein TNCV_4529791 [Trichonephila clavipes]|nr:hypothetical protein TNCV_4529791 [Trichonephila clavipes]